MRHLATIRNVSDIVSIEGADRIELAKIDGWQCVVSKHSFKPGDACVYFEIDSFLPIEGRYEFLRKPCYRKIPELGDKRSEGFRLRTAKFLGVLSQGLCLPLSEFPELNPNGLCIGSDVTEILGVDLFVPPIPTHLAGDVKGMFPSFIKKTDEERIQNLPEYFDKHKDLVFEVTEKVDGTSMTVYLNRGEFGVCSKGIDWLEDDKNSLWKMARKLDLEKLLRDIGGNIALQGELMGEGIQKNRLRIKGHQFYLFNIWDIDTQSYLTPTDRVYLIDKYIEHIRDNGIMHAPFLDEITLSQKTMDGLLGMANGMSCINPDMKREGLVFKSNDKVGPEIISFKVISNDYLLK